MTEPDVYATVRDVLVSVKSETDPIPADQIKPELELDESPLALDSLDLLRLIAGIEERLGVIAQDEGFVELRTVGDLVNAVRQWLVNTTP
jgi:acyl carrier protein